MSYRLPCSERKKRGHRAFFFNLAVLITVLSWLISFTACGGAPASVTGNSPANTSGSNSSANLTISATLPSASVGSNYNATLAVTGGTAPYTFSVASGALPQGVLLDNNSGAISGTPSASGSFAFAISVSDSKGLSKQKSLQMT